MTNTWRPAPRVRLTWQHGQASCSMILAVCHVLPSSEERYSSSSGCVGPDIPTSLASRNASAVTMIVPALSAVMAPHPKLAHGSRLAALIETGFDHVAPWSFDVEK